MRYKVGDKVVLKIDQCWSPDAIQAIENLPNKIATIRKVVESDDENGDYDYYMKEMYFGWFESEIECLASEWEETTRF